MEKINQSNATRANKGRKQVIFEPGGGNDTCTKAKDQAHEHDGLTFPLGPMTREKSKKLKEKLHSTVQDFISKGLQALMKNQEFQNSPCLLNEESHKWVSSSLVAAPNDPNT
ncbi:hypothetical protein GQ457_12G014660 [Hibiscus cannabinus]